MLKINLNCQFSDFQLSINEALPSNKIIGLFGASGSGKSKLLRQLLGFDREYQLRTDIQFNDHHWQNSLQKKFVATQERKIGYLPQTVDLFPHLNVKDNIFFSRTDRTASIEKAWIEHIVEQLAISDIQNNFPSQLSGGQKQRVGLARAIVAAEQLLILDEPLSSIGEDHKAKIMQLIKSLSQERQLTVIQSSHSRFEHAYLTDHLLTLKNGRVMQSGIYQTIASDIGQRFAQVPDAINNIEAIAINFDKNFSVNLLKTKEHSLWAGHEPIKHEAKVTMEIRAKDISISLNPIKNSSMLNCLKTKLVDTNEISDHQYLLKLKFENAYLIAFITKKSFVELNLQTGLELYASFKAVSVISI